MPPALIDYTDFTGSLTGSDAIPPDDIVKLGDGLMRDATPGAHADRPSPGLVQLAIFKSNGGASAADGQTDRQTADTQPDVVPNDAETAVDSDKKDEIPDQPRARPNDSRKRPLRTEEDADGRILAEMSPKQLEDFRDMLDESIEEYTPKFKAKMDEVMALQRLEDPIRKDIDEIGKKLRELFGKTIANQLEKQGVDTSGGPRSIDEKDFPKVYRAILDEALKQVGGSKALEQIPDETTAAALLYQFSLIQTYDPCFETARWASSA